MIRNTEAFYLNVIFWEASFIKGDRKGEIERDRSLLETYIDNWPNAVHNKLLTQIKMKGENMQDCPKMNARNKVSQ